MSNGKLSWREFNKQIEDVASRDLDESAKVIWMYLITCKRGGLGKANLGERLQVFNFDEALELLIIEGLVRKRNGKYMPVLVGCAPQEEEAKLSFDMNREVTVMIDEYQQGRGRSAQRPLPRPNKKHFAAAYKFCVEQSVTFEDYLSYAERIWSGWEGRPGAYPLPEHLAGQFLQNRFVDGLSSEGGKKPVHAGHTYANVDDFREALLRGGFEAAAALAAPRIRNLVSWAKDCLEMPEDTEPPRGPHAEAILFLIKELSRDP